MIYGISDTHGDYKRLLALMRAYKIVDENNDWCAGNSVLVNCGDSTDRGKNGINVLKIFHKLDIQAQEAGGRAIHLMGNHDAIILHMAQLIKSGEWDAEHSMIFTYNGGKMSEANTLAKSRLLYPWMHKFPLMCKVDNYLFQHADGFAFYRNAISKAHSDNDLTPESRVKAANLYGANQAASHWGSWNLFYDMTNARLWDNRPEEMDEYLNSFDADCVVHGHTGQLSNSPLYYLGNKAVNIDAVMSSGYRKDEDRGCVLVLDSPGTDIII